MLGGPESGRLPCGRKMHEANHAGIKGMRSSVLTLTARGAEWHLAGLSRALRGLPLQQGVEHVWLRKARFDACALLTFELPRLHGRSHAFSAWTVGLAEFGCPGTGFTRTLTLHLFDAMVATTTARAEDQQHRNAWKMAAYTKTMLAAVCFVFPLMQSLVGRNSWCCANPSVRQDHGRPLIGGSAAENEGEKRWSTLPEASQDVFKGLLLSCLGQTENVRNVLKQAWVETWTGWSELDVEQSDQCHSLLQRFLRIAEANACQEPDTDETRLRELSNQGYELLSASSHGANNCLIDSLLLGLSDLGLLPAHLLEASNLQERAALARQCRKHLEGAVGACVAQSENGAFPYLDAHRDAPHIVLFLLRAFHTPAPESLLITVHDRFPNVDCEADRNRIWIGDRSPSMGETTKHLHLNLYNHTTLCGQGYHFDTIRVRKPMDRKRSAENLPEVNSDKKRHPVAIGLEARNPGKTDDEPNKTQSTPQEVCSSLMSTDIQVQLLLQHFFWSRGAAIQVQRADAAEIVACWNDNETVALKLHTLLQAGVNFADSGIHAARRLVDQWRAYYVTCTQGPGQRLGSTIDNHSVPQAPSVEQSPVQKATAAESCARQDPESVLPSSASMAPPAKRLRTKQTVLNQPLANPEASAHATNDLLSDEYILKEWRASHGNPDPRALQDADLEVLGAKLKSKPLLPTWMQAVQNTAFDLPDYYCSFEGCDFESADGVTLETHILAKHAVELKAVASRFSNSLPVEIRSMEAYRAGISWRCQQGAPIAHKAIDRKALRKFREAQLGDKVGSAICFFCAQRFSYSNGMCEGDGIRWQTIVGPNPTDIMTLPLEEARRSLSYQTYWETYGTQHSAAVQAQLHEQLKDWSADVALQDHTLSIICCPEDKECWWRCPKHKVCKNCRAPVCQHCRRDLTYRKQAPTLALANDLLIFYPPQQLYSKEVTFMELVCASPCFTAMACFSLEKKLLGDRALDQDAFMPRNRLVARGNATTFPLAWEELLQSMQEAAGQAQEGTLRLPKVGADLSAVMSVIIKAGGPNSNVADTARIIHQARVRRTVVLELLADAKAREHPAYRRVNMEDALLRAEQLPEDGVPAELIALLPHDDDLENVQRQKAATPVRNLLEPREVQQEFAHACKPNAVVNERTAAGFGDENAQHAATLHAIASGSQHSADSAIVIHTGNRLLDQFEPWYFAFAFAFLFPYGTGMPDPPAWSTKPRYRRPANAPRVNLNAWMRCMARRCEAQVNRDWTFGFTTWNLFFRSSINLARNMAPYDTPVFDEAQGKFCTLTSLDVEAGALQLVKALEGVYSDTRGNTRPVNGDVSKLPYVKNLRPAARKLLQNIRHTARALPGTQEARRQIRFEISAMRIRYGVPVFITVSPDEAHQWLFVRMARTRASDPVRAAFPWQEWMSGDRDFPPLDDDLVFPIHVERLRRHLPGWQQRRTILARDPLASVDGFHVLLRLLLRHIFGLHMCELCPTCDETQSPCADHCGSSASLLGGAFGRVDALYVTLEAQKSTGSLHGHIQCFIQCLHQHTPLTEIFQLSQTKLAALREEYCRYQAHVSHSVYAGQTDEEIKTGIEASERAWPEHEHDNCMTMFPSYQLQRSAPIQDKDDADAWEHQYLEKDVVQLQYLKQHHYHPLNLETGERTPLRGCQKKANPGICKSDYPRHTWLCHEPTILCPCKLQKHGFSDRGRKNRLGSLHGPYGHPYLNPCHPAILASMRGGNNDVQIPYRLPYACLECGSTLSKADRQAIALAAQRAQDAQTGYCSDYCSKNQPMGFHEIKEFQKGHLALHATLKGEPLERIGKRHANRFLSDAYCKGLVRGQVECCNLRAKHVDNQIVAAERISTTGFAAFPGRSYLDLLETIHGEPGQGHQKTKFVKTQPAPGSGARHLRESVEAQAYGHRPPNSECWWLSPYEFVMYWKLLPTRVPYSRAEWEAAPQDAWDVKLTAAGVKKLEGSEPEAPARLKPAVHYVIQIPETSDRLLFPPRTSTQTLRHNWYLARRVRPRCPQFASAPVPKGFAENAEHNAKLTSVYFRAWTLNLTNATFTIPYLGHLRGEDDSWEASLRAWLLRLPSAETKRHVGNFLSVYRVRPAGEADNNSDDDDVDEPFHLQPADIASALQTLLPARNSRAGKTCNDQRAAQMEAAVKQVDHLWKSDAAARVTPDNRSQFTDIDPKTARQAIRGKKSEDPLPVSSQNNPGSITVTLRKAAEGSVQTWLADLKSNSRCNADQRSFCEKVAGRVLTELQESRLEPNHSFPHAEPLRWVLHGGPGIGKSHTLKLLRTEFFEQVLEWQHGVEFQIVSFQAVMAELLDGDTIHHALGLDWSGDRTQNVARTLERAHHALQWRWLILDEFSMVSAELLAQLELRCRELMRDLSVAKYGQHDGKVRPFGGLNVILAGDLYQLPPPKGTFLADIPWDLLAGRKPSKQATGHQGQTLLWGGAAAGMQGITELLQCERTRDTWLTDVQDQLRHGQLSNDNHAFLHGRPTAVPGSWTAGRVACGKLSCAALVSTRATPEYILQHECATCANDRVSRELVARGSEDPRFHAEFANAVSIFGTNDIKYHVNKVRAVQWATSRGKQLHLAVARDKASATVLQEKPDLAAEKLQWLQRHDKECGELYGMLPLCVGMPVRATDHLDRKRGILKGCRGTVVGWGPVSDLPADRVVVWNKLPEVVYVRFDTIAPWHLDGIPEPNVYPVTTCKRVWFLDRNRKHPQLRVWRTQFPLAPAFAITAHVAQGQTISQGVITDLCLSHNGNPFTAYVAFTRVQGRSQLLIFRPFDAAPFQKGIGLGRDLLLRHLRGTPINWPALLAKYCEERPCVECRERKVADAFTRGQWKREDAERVCRECVNRHALHGTPWQCNVCKLWHPETNFATKHQKNPCSFYRVCLTCELRKPCGICKESKPEAAFGAAAWKARHTARRICKECSCKQRSCWFCAACSERKPKNAFSIWQSTRPDRPHGHQICNPCHGLQVACRFARAANKRLLPLRARVERTRMEKVLAEVRADISARKAAAANPEAPAVHTQPAMPSAAGPPNQTTKPDQKHQRTMYDYICPPVSRLPPVPCATGKLIIATSAGKNPACEMDLCRAVSLTTSVPLVAPSFSQRRLLAGFGLNIKMQKAVLARKRSGKHSAGKFQDLRLTSCTVLNSSTNLKDRLLKDGQLPHAYVRDLNVTFETD